MPGTARAAEEVLFGVSSRAPSARCTISTGRVAYSSEAYSVSRAGGHAYGYGVTHHEKRRELIGAEQAAAVAEFRELAAGPAEAKRPEAVGVQLSQLVARARPGPETEILITHPTPRCGAAASLGRPARLALWSDSSLADSLEIHACGSTSTTAFLVPISASSRLQPGNDPRVEGSVATPPSRAVRMFCATLIEVVHHILIGVLEHAYRLRLPGCCGSRGRRRLLNGLRVPRPAVEEDGDVWIAVLAIHADDTATADDPHHLKCRQR